MKFVRNAGALLISTRLRQLSALFWEDRAKLYKEQGVLFKPNWGVVVMLIKQQPGCTINDIAKELGFAHTSVLKIVKDMQAEKYLLIKKDKNDARRKLIFLTKKGIKEHQKYDEMKSWIESINKDILQDTGLMEAMEKVEAKFEEASYYKRLNHKALGIEIVPYKKSHASAFKSLNKEWIEKYFKMEDKDQEVLTRPDHYIIKKGGAILMAKSKKEIIGTVALMPLRPKEIELTKMAVDPSFRGLGIGDLLLRKAIVKARELNYKNLVLYSSVQLKPALSLYEKHGFVEVPLEKTSGYSRASIKMSMVL